jgi:predicted enzyme related to lactoylglutathione lyase
MLFLLPVLSLAIPALATVLGAVGIDVSSIEKSSAFYTSSLGLNKTGAIDAGDFREAILKLPGTSTGSALVLVEYKKPKTIANPPVKLVFYVDDVKSSIEKMRKAGATIVAEPGSLKVKNTVLPTALARDPDGYLVEVNPLTSLGAKFS